METSDILRRELEARDLVVRQTVLSDGQIYMGLDAGSTGLRAIVIGVADLQSVRQQRDLKQLLLKLAAPAARDNLSIVIEARGESNRVLAGKLLRDAFRELYDPDRTYVSNRPPSGAAQLIRSFNPGLPWRDLPFAGNIPADMAAEELQLVQRALSDATSVTVERIGLKPIYRVDAYMAEGPNRHPFLLKMVKGHDWANAERGNYLQHCIEVVPYFSLPPLAAERCVSGPTRTCLVYHYADHAITLAESMQTRSPTRSIAALFDGALRQWRADVRDEHIALGDYLFDKGVASTNLEDYVPAFNKAQRDGRPTVRPPEAVVQSIRGYPQRNVRTCMSHGDLHARNVLANAAAEEVSLIDFARTNRAPTTVDPAELEVSLAFIKLSNVPELTAAEIDQLYSGDLFSETQLSRSANKRALGIQQVRRQVACEVDRSDYAITLAASLMFYARRSAEAYRAADRLSQMRP